MEGRCYDTSSFLDDMILQSVVLLSMLDEFKMRRYETKNEGVWYSSCPW